MLKIEFFNLKLIFGNVFAFWSTQKPYAVNFTVTINGLLSVIDVFTCQNLKKYLQIINCYSRDSSYKKLLILFL